MTRSVFRDSLLALAFTALVAAPSLTFAADPAPAAAEHKGPALKDVIKDDAVYATYDGGKITGKDVREVTKQLPPQLQAAPADKLMELVVNQLVNDRLVDKAAADEGLDDDKQVQDRLVEVKKQLVRERYVEKNMEGKVTDAAIKAKYEELIKKVPQQDEIRASHILVSDEKTAKDIIVRLGKGEDFAKLAKQYSTDPTKANGGDLGYFAKAAMVKEFGDAAFAMQKGEVSKTPVKSQFGYHVIKVVDRRKQPLPQLDQVKDRVKQQLNEEQVRKMVEDLRTKSDVKLTLPAAK